MLRPETAIYQILIAFGFAVILNVPRWIEAQEHDTEVYTISGYSGGFSDFVFNRRLHTKGLLRDGIYRQAYHGWIWTGLMYFLPLLALAFFNCKIFKQVENALSYESRN